MVHACELVKLFLVPPLTLFTTAKVFVCVIINQPIFMVQTDHGIPRSVIRCYQRSRGSGTSKHFFLREPLAQGDASIVV